ncbi:putative O-methyltransferase [Calycina marina]|uniref:O-methyltransferase n=1 Tax=Calycina marina TaxID=1763456 RepID=A0A9P7YXD1_9HELO|nr:putative O-methyltransferase [Calycina marina]
MGFSPEGVKIIQAVTGASTLGFFPVAIHFEIFPLLVNIKKAVTSAEVVEAVAKNPNVLSKLNLQLAEDVLFIMAGAGFVTQIGEKYAANAITIHLVNFPSSIHGVAHFTREALLSSAFIYPKLLDSGFEYPFLENGAAFQYAQKQLGNESGSKQSFYATLHDLGRLESFNTFMEGKFGISTKMPERVKGFGYDLDAVMSDMHSLVVVDIGGGQGMMLLELKEEYPHLTSKNLILQEYNPDSKPGSDITAMKWDAKTNSPQPILGAKVYNLMHVLHNTPDLEALDLLKKLAIAMAPDSRIWIHEFSHSLSNSSYHALMISLFAGRERTPTEWALMARLAGLRITFEHYAEVGEGLIEMMRL